jgi:energy-coupling factor transporter ATP-binding protein EcfA2
MTTSPILRVRDALVSCLRDVPALTLAPKESITTPSGYSLTAPFTVKDDRNGFLGIFQQYTVSNLDDLKSDLRVLADIVEGERLNGYLPPSIILFAVILTDNTLGSNAETRFVQSIGHMQAQERVLELVGLNRLLWDETDTPRALLRWNKADKSRLHPPDTEVERFFAPLLVRVRSFQRSSTDELLSSQPIRVWQASVHERIRELLAPVDSMATGSRDAVERAVQAKILSELQTPLAQIGQSVTIPEQPLTLHQIERLDNFRRFKHLDKTIPFGKDLTILYGPNGSGKSSLLEAISLALAGRVERHDNDVMNPHAFVHIGTDQQVTASFGSLSVRYGRQGPPSSLKIQSREESMPLPIRTMYMSQASLRWFLTSDSKERLQWFKLTLGTDESVITSVFDRLRGELRDRLERVWNHLTGEPFRATRKGLIAPLTTALQKRLNLQSVEDCINRIQALRIDLTKLSVACGPTTIGIEFSGIGPKLDDQLHRLRSRIMDLFAALQGNHDVIPVLDEVQSLYKSVERLLSLLVDKSPETIIVAYKQAAAKVKALAPPVSASEAMSAVQTELVEAKQELDKAEEMAGASRAFLDLANHATEIRRIWRSVLPTYGKTTVPHELNHLLEAAGVLADGQHTLLRWNQEAQTRLTGVQQHVAQITNSLTKQQTIEGETERRRQAEVELTRTTQRLLGTLGPEVKLVDSVIEAVESLCRNVNGLTQRFEPLQPFLVKELTSFFARPSAQDWGGIYSLCYAWTYLKEREDQVNKAVDDAVSQLLVGDFGSTMREIQWALTSCNWGHLPFHIEKKKGGVDLTTTELGVSPDQIYNMAEQNIMGLAFFFTAYLYVGSAWSKAIIVDDPFQNLDDTNLLAFVRLFDDIARAAGAEQRVLALHQENLKDHIWRNTALEHGAATAEQVEGQSFGAPSLVLVEVYPVNDHESQVETRTAISRQHSPRLFSHRSSAQASPE